MSIRNQRKLRYYWLTFSRHDFRASITVFFVALPLCLGISLASGAPVYSGILAGIVGGTIISLISRSELSVSGPAAGLTAICAAAISELGTMEIFFVSVSVAGILQIILGLLRLGGFTHFIPSAVIKGMLAAIGILLISKQIPLLVGYDRPDFWTNEIFNLVTFKNGFQGLGSLYHHTSTGAVLIALCTMLILILWKKYLAQKIPFLPASFITVVSGVLLAIGYNTLFPDTPLRPAQFVNIPHDILSQIKPADFTQLFAHELIWKYAVIICFVASLETLLSITAIDKLDPLNRITPQNRELIAQGTGNFISGWLGGLPITSVIVRSSANAEAGARSRISAFMHGLWLLLVVLIAIPLINLIPYCVLAVILVRTGYNLAKPSMIKAIYRQGREQFIPFVFTIVAILLTDLLIGVLIGIAYAVYFLIKHTLRAGYVLKEKKEGHIRHFIIELALNVSFLNKKRIMEMLDQLPDYAVVEINGADSIYIDQDILEVFHDYKAKALRKHIQLTMINIPDVETIELH